MFKDVVGDNIIEINLADYLPITHYNYGAFSFTFGVIMNHFQFFSCVIQKKSINFVPKFITIIFHSFN